MKQRVAAAIASEDADWTNQAIHYFKQQYFGPLHSPHQFLPIGTKENLQIFSAEAVRKWYQDRVLDRPRVLAIFGDIDVDQARTLAAKYFATAPDVTAVPHAEPTDRSATTQPVGGEARITVSRVAMQKTEQPLAGVVIGFDANSVVTQADQPLLTMADCMTSGYAAPTGYLFDVLRGKGLVYVVDAEDLPGIVKQSPGVFMAYAGCDPHKINDVVDLMLENIARLQGTPADIQPDWFERSKQLIINADALENETPDAQAQTAALDELSGLGFGYHAGFADRINRTTLQEVQEEARQYLSRCVVTISTPMPEIVKQSAGERKYASFPPVQLTARGVTHDTGAGGAK